MSFQSHSDVAESDSDYSDSSSILSVTGAPLLSAAVDSSISSPNPKHRKREPKGNNAPSADPSAHSKSQEGTKYEIQTLYEGPPKCKCCKNWVEEYPDDLRMDVEEQPETKQKALVVRMRKNHSDGKPLVLDSVIVQSSSLKETLGQVFQGYAGITTSLKKLVFKTPFRPFHYRWKALTDILEQQEQNDADAAAYTKLLYGVLHAELRDEMVEVEDHIGQGVITYNLLWALFEPGTVVFTSDDGQDRFLIVDETGYDHQRGYFAVSAKFVDWDGHRFGYDKETLITCEFAGTKRITDLEVYPASLHPSEEDVKSRVVSRGKKFQALRGFHYKEYSGSVKARDGPENGNQIRHIAERLVVDADAYFSSNPDKRLCLELLGSNSFMPQLRVTDDQHIDQHGGRRQWRCGTGMMAENAYEKKILARQIENGERIVEREAQTVFDLDEEQLLVCSPKVRGYSLKTKSWDKFEVDSITDITWNNDAFSSLLLPPGYKSLILSFVEGKATDKHAFDDIIEGKGVGIVMLLVGNPGIGKTLTAEAVADKARKPLYVLSAGELGQKAEEVEKRLNHILKLAEKWDAVLLFDECDVFLQERSMSHLTHNEIVAVFLRVIEYYRGILIMTSNRGNAIDRAFQSRIHLTLHYPELDMTSREQIWRRCTTNADPENVLDDQVYRRLSQLAMNGRQIRNVVKIAMLLAAKEETRMGIEQIRTVLEATQEAGEESLNVLNGA